jgi:hypothetical protein
MGDGLSAISYQLLVYARPSRLAVFSTGRL